MKTPDSAAAPDTGAPIPGLVEQTDAFAYKHGESADDKDVLFYKRGDGVPETDALAYEHSEANGDNDALFYEHGTVSPETDALAYKRGEPNRESDVFMQ
jgi:hypothetical protein